MTTQGTEAEAEQTIASGIFGTVTSKRVIYNSKRGWFSGGAREDIPLKHVTSVRFTIARSVLAGILFVMVGPILMFYPDGGALAAVAGLALLALAVLSFWGSPSVAVNTAGRDASSATGLPWQRKDAAEFVDAIRDHMARS